MAQPPSLPEFAKALARHWKGSMSGGAGIFAAVGGLWLGWTNGQALFWGAVAAFAVGSYLVWRDEREKVIALDLFSKREAARLRIAELITEGAGIRNEALDEYNPFTHPELVGWANRVQAWHNVVLSTLKSVSAADAEWYRTLNEIPPPAIPMAEPSEGADENGLKVYAMLNFRLRKLEQLVSGEKGNLLIRR